MDSTLGQSKRRRLLAGDPGERYPPVPAGDPWSSQGHLRHSGYPDSSGGLAGPGPAPDGSSSGRWYRPGPEEPEPEDEAPLRPGDVQVLLSMCVGRQGRMGLAYIDLDAPERILNVSDVLDPGPAGLSRLRASLLAGGRCGLWLAPSRVPTELLEAAESGTTEDAAGPPLAPPPGGPGQHRRPSCTVVVLKASDFEFEACRQRLLQLGVDGEDPTNRRASELELRGRGRLDLRNEQLVRAAGALVRFMERHRVHLGDIGDPQQGLHVHRIRMISLDTMLFVDDLTLESLQVFKEDRHPSVVNGRGRPKEGLSLFGLLEPFVASVTGRATLRRWLQQPSRDIQLLRGRLDAVEELCKPKRRELLRELHRELREVRDTRMLLRRIFGCGHFDNAHDWRALIVTFEHMSVVLGLLKAHRLDDLFVVEGFEELTADVVMVEDMLRGFVDAEVTSPGSSDVRIRAGVDERLDSVRAQYDAIDNHLTEAAQLERARLVGRGISQRLAGAVTFHYFPQLGFHASVPNPFAQPGGDNDAADIEALKDQAPPPPADDWHYQFAWGGRLFCKCGLALRLDEEVGDLVVAARELEVELLLGVTERLRLLEPRLCRAAQLLGDLDALAGLAAAAMQFGWTRPRFSRDPRRLRIAKGRHPLVEATLAGHQGFVPNSTKLGVEPPAEGDGANGDPAAAAAAAAEGAEAADAGSAKVQVVTGANMAGKTVYLKQVGLIVILAQVGSFVPAAKAELGLCDTIFSRMHSFEGSSSRCSSFGADVANLSLAISHATPASLVLLDEFGKGTHPADGVALLGATLEHFRNWEDGPKVIATTHFTEVFKLGLVALDRGPPLQVSSMQILPPERDRQGVAYLYQLLPGVCEDSFGLECARRAGLPDDVIARAEELLAGLRPAGEAAAAPAVAAGRGLEAEGRCGPLPGTGSRPPLPADWRGLVERLAATDASDAGAVQQLLELARAAR